MPLDIRAIVSPDMHGMQVCLDQLKGYSVVVFFSLLIVTWQRSRLYCGHFCDSAFFCGHLCDDVVSLDTYVKVFVDI